MRRVLLFYPCKGAQPVWQARNQVSIARTNFPGCQILIRFLEGAPIQQARNEAVQMARDEKCGELVMNDSDLNLTPEILGRLLSHKNELIVCAPYAHRSLETHWHIQPTNPPSQEEPSGLLKVKQSAIGCSKIRIEVFDRIQADNPDRLGMLTSRDSEGHNLIWEFFPFELVGLNTPTSRLKEMIELACQLQKDGIANTDLKIDARLIARQIHEIATMTFLADSHHVSEDYNFCRLATNSGIPIKVDTQIIVQHASEVFLPIATAQLKDMLAEPWRQNELSILNGTKS